MVNPQIQFDSHNRPISPPAKYLRRMKIDDDNQWNVVCVLGVCRHKENNDEDDTYTTIADKHREDHIHLTSINLKKFPGLLAKQGKRCIRIFSESPREGNSTWIYHG